MSFKVGLQTRKSVSLLVSLLMTSQVMFPAHLAAATPEVYAEQANEFAGLIANTEKVAAGQPKNSYGPDRFLLLDQAVRSKTYVGQDFDLFRPFSAARDRELNQHRSRVSRAEAVLAQAHALGAIPGEALCVKFIGDANLTPEKIEEGLVEHLSEGRRKDIPFFVYREKSDIERLSCVRAAVAHIIEQWTQQIEDQTQITEVDTQVPNITKAPAKTRQPYLNWWEVEVDLVRKTQTGETEEIVDNLKLSRNADFADVNRSGSMECTTGDCEFVLKARGLRIHDFHIPVTSVTTFGPYVVFTHKDSYDPATGIQYLSFLDLASYGASLGMADIPVFSLPIQLGQEVHNIKIAGKAIRLENKIAVPMQAFAAASEVQRAVFNMTANFVSPEDLADLMPYVQSLETYTDKVLAAEAADLKSQKDDAKESTVLLKKLGQDVAKQLEASNALKSFASGKKMDLDPVALAQVSEEMKALLDGYSSNLTKSQLVNDRMASVAEKVNAKHGVVVRVKAFLNKVTTPPPNASLKVKRALVYIGAQKNVDQRNFLNQMLDRPWLASTVAAAGVIAAVSPETFGTVAQTGLAFATGILDYVKFTAAGIGEAVVTGTVATFDPIFSMGGSLAEQYINNGNWYRTAWGVGAFSAVIMGIYFVPHTIFNVHNMMMDRKNQRRTGDRKGFVHHQNEFVKEYFQKLADDEGQRRKMADAENEKVTFSAEEEEAIQNFITERKAQQKPPWFVTRLAKGTKNAFAKMAENVGLYKPNKDLSKERVKTWMGAVASLAFSFPAMELTLTRWARAWNWFAGSRYTSVGFLTLRDLGLKSGFPIFIRPKPISAGVRLLRPDFFTTVVAKQGPKLTNPTVLNGGLRGWELRDLTFYKEKVFGKAPLRSAEEVASHQLRQSELQFWDGITTDSEMRDLIEDQTRLLNASEIKAITENFEAAILPAEEAVMKIGFNGAIARMPEFLTNKDDMVELFTKKPLKSVAEKRVRDMPVNVRTFLRLFQDRVYERAMQDYLTEVLEKETRRPVPAAEGMDLKNLKKMILATNKDIHYANHVKEPYKFDVARVSEIATKYANSPEFFAEVAVQAKKGEFNMENFLKNRKYNLMGDMDPSQNPSMARYADVQERLKSPNALSRAVRSEISKLLVTFPLDLGFHMFFSAAIFEGAYKPIQEQWLGENSVFYLSQTSFYMGMAAGFTMGMMADAWMKLQQDSRQDKMGGFQNIPVGQDADSGFLRWYMKQFNHKENSLGGNWAYSNSLSFWNMPATLANYGVFYFAFSGRFDLSALLAAYPIIFGTPIGAFSMKVEQAFERASDFAARGIQDEKWMAHPELQAFISAEKQATRNKFQLWNDFFWNVKGNWMGNAMIIPTSLGPRGYARSLMGGYLVEELIVNNVLDPVTKVTAGVPVVGPVVSKVAGMCEHLLTNGNVDLTKLRK